MTQPGAHQDSIILAGMTLENNTFLEYLKTLLNGNTQQNIATAEADKVTKLEINKVRYFFTEITPEKRDLRIEYPPEAAIDRTALRHLANNLPATNTLNVSLIAGELEHIERLEVVFQNLKSDTKNFSFSLHVDTSLLETETNKNALQAATTTLNNATDTTAILAAIQTIKAIINPSLSLDATINSVQGTVATEEEGNGEAPTVIIAKLDEDSDEEEEINYQRPSLSVGSPITSISAASLQRPDEAMLRIDSNESSVTQALQANNFTHDISIQQQQLSAQLTILQERQQFETRRLEEMRELKQRLEQEVVNIQSKIQQAEDKALHNDESLMTLSQKIEGTKEKIRYLKATIGAQPSIEVMTLAVKNIEQVIEKSNKNIVQEQGKIATLGITSEDLESAISLHETWLNAFKSQLLDFQAAKQSSEDSLVSVRSNIDGLESRNAELSQTLTRLNEDLTGNSTRAETIQTTLQDLRTVQQELVSTIQRTSAKNDSLKNSITEVSQALPQLQASLQNSQQSLTRAQEHLQTTNEYKGIAERALQQHLETISAKKEALEMLEKEQLVQINRLNDTRAHCARLKNDVERLQNEYFKTVKSFDIYEKTLDKRIQYLVSLFPEEHIEQANRAFHNFYNAARELSMLQASNTTDGDDIQHWNSVLYESHTELQKLMENLVISPKQSLLKEAADLLGFSKEDRVDYQQLQKLIVDFSSSCFQLINSGMNLGKAKAAWIDAREEMRTAEQQHQNQAAELEQTKATIRTVQEELTALDGQTPDLQQQCQQTAETYDAVSQKVSEFELKVKENTAMLQTTTNTITDLKSAVTEDAEKLQNLRQELTNLQGKIQEQEALLDASRALVTTVKKGISACESEQRSISKQLGEKRAEKTTLDTRIADLTTQITGLEGVIATEVAEITTKKAQQTQLQESNQLIASAVDKISNLQKDKGQLQVDIDTVTNQNNQLQALQENLTLDSARYNELLTARQELTAHLNLLREEHNATQNNYAATTGQIDDQNRLIHSIKGQINSLQAKLAALNGPTFSSRVGEASVQVPAGPPAGLGVGPASVITKHHRLG